MVHSKTIDDMTFLHGNGKMTGCNCFRTGRSAVSEALIIFDELFAKHEMPNFRFIELRLKQVIAGFYEAHVGDNEVFFGLCPRSTFHRSSTFLCQLGAAINPRSFIKSDGAAVCIIVSTFQAECVCVHSAPMHY